MNFCLATVINFCSNDYPFLRHCIDAVKPFSSQLIIPVCDHFFDGKKEDRETLDRIYLENEDVQFIEFPFDGKSLYGSVHWHNLARMIGRFFLNEGIHSVLFLDCDEIADTARFIHWLQSFPVEDYAAVNFANYWYFRESRFQAKAWEHTPLLIRKEKLDGPLMLNEKERAGMYDACPGKKAGSITAEDGLPMFHHYSWVRTKQQLLRKVVSWSHNWQRDWASQVEEEFSHAFNGTDFVHGYEFTEVVPPFIEIDLLKKPKECSATQFSHVRQLSNEDIAKIDVSLNFDIPLCL